ncbi:MAG: DNA primase, partial [bacterium]|nr:DNA primase [bacterium]
KIKDRVDVVELVGSYLKLTKAGVNYKGRCPFHNEKTPSFFVNPERQIWHCFGCSKGGDVFGFVKDIEGVEFPEALRILAKRAGVDLEPASPEYKQFQSEKTRLYEISELSAKFFEKQLWQSNTGKKVLGYLKGRGASDDIIKKFRLGYAPETWDALVNFLVKSGYGEGELVNSGVAIKRETTNYKPPAYAEASAGRQATNCYDRFRNRLMFPVCDLAGQVVGFSGRIFDQPVPTPRQQAGAGTTTSDFPQVRVEPDKNQNVVAKYINTPQTPIYDKSKILYGLDKARVDIRTKNRCLAVEGNMDVVMSHQAGVTNAIATSGTAMTAGHLKIIKRYTDNLDLCFDDDGAGEIATKRGVDLALGYGFNVGVVSINDPGVKDPADYVKKYGSKWVEHSGSSRPFMEFFFQKAAAGIDATTALGKKIITQKLLPMIKAIGSKVEQAHWISELAMEAKTGEDILYAELANISGPQVFDGQDEEAPRPSNGLFKFKKYEEGIAEILSLKPEMADAVDLNLELWSNELKAVLSSFNIHDKTVKIKNTASNTASNSKNNSEILRFRAGEIWAGFDDEALRLELVNLVCKAKLWDVQDRLVALSFDIKEAEKSGNKDRLNQLIIKFSELSSQLSSIK